MNTNLAQNPFFILELPPTCSRQQVEREGQKLLGLLELNLTRAATYPTPLGPQPRTPELIRGAMAELRDPVKRIFHELWADVATPDPKAENAGETTQPDDTLPPTTEDHATAWPGIWALFDWRSP